MANHKKTTEEFISNSKEKFGNIFSYEKTEYVNANTPVIITCPVHGDFEIIPHQHLKKFYKSHGIVGGCPLCFCDKNKEGNGRRLTQEKFLEKAKEVHGDKYDYSEVNYINSRSKITIICPKHGAFYPIANLFLRGTECPICNESKLEREIADFLAKNNIEYERLKRFEWLKNKIALPLDFYLPKYNVAIECQGRQHFETNSFFEHEPLEHRQELDSIKKMLCNEHGIKILYYANYKYNFPYEVITDKNTLLEQIIRRI